MLIVLFAVVGIMVGILINVLADDLPARVKPRRPHCIQCGYEYEVRSWPAVGRRLMHGGRCPSCELPMRRRVLLVELLTPLLFALLPLLVSETADLFFGALYIAILILVIVIDIEHRLILHVVTIPSTVLAIVGSYFISSNAPLMAVAGAVFGFVVFFAFYWFGQRLFGPGALGFGDVTLAMTMGAMLGFPYIVFALIIGILLGGLITFLLILSGRLSLRSSVAYGPFLALAGIITVVWGEQILRWYIS
jgi:leader peptidase (prepilin peptidase)/N-methyltransferase